MSTEKRDFDKAAASWDENPGRVRLADDIARAVSERIALTPGMDVMDFGCGTGLVTFRLQPLVRSVTGVDSSQGMLDVFKAKAAKLGSNNVRAQLADLDRGDVLTGRYDLVLCNMTLHHIKKIEPLFAQFHNVAAPGGHLCVADLDLEGGRFHEDKTGVFHAGFDREALRRIFAKAGFDDIRDARATEVVKPGSDGETRRFSVFLMTGRRRPD